MDIKARRLTTAAFLVALLFLPALSQGATEHVLNNGIKVIVVEDHKSPIAVFQIWYRVGSMDEPPGKSGMSHLLEHMMFKGTARYGSKVLSRTVQRYGGTDNAFTSKDYTAYFQILPSDRIALSLDFESDRMSNLLLDEGETLSERDVVMEERRTRYEDDPQSSLFEEAVATAFKVHPYRRPIIGWMQDLKEITRQDLAAHYREYYSPQNSFVVVAGDVDTEKILKEIEDSFASIEPGAAIERPEREEPPQRGLKRVYLKREAELPFVLALYHAPGFPHGDAYALEVLRTVLSGGKSGRLYRSMVYESKMALSAFADYSGIQRDPYLFFVGATAAPGTDPERLEASLLSEIEKIKEAPPSEFELNKAKNQIEADFVMGQDSVFYQAMLIGQFEVVGGWRLMEKYLEGIRAVSAEDVSRAARDYLREENCTIGVLIPEKP